jgi:hypothetical protein
LALIGREGLMGMIGVDKIGEIRRAYFEQRLPIEEIVRTLSVSRAMVRKVTLRDGLANNGAARAPLKSVCA